MRRACRLERCSRRWDRRGAPASWLGRSSWPADPIDVCKRHVQVSRDTLRSGPRRLALAVGFLGIGFGVAARLAGASLFPGLALVSGCVVRLAARPALLAWRPWAAGR